MTEHPHAHVVDQHRAARHEASRDYPGDDRPARQEAARDEAERGPVPAPTCSCGRCLVCALEAGRRWR